MNQRKYILPILLLLAGISLLALGHSLVNSLPFTNVLQSLIAPPDTTKKVKALDVELENEDIPDSLLHPRWKVQRTTPITYNDLQQGSYDLARPENLKQSVEYNDSQICTLHLVLPRRYSAPAEYV